MITCPSCNHQNPEGSLQCENCYTPLPATVGCPNCGASVQTDATFCGQCGFNLQAENPLAEVSLAEPAVAAPEKVFLPEEIPLSAASSNILPETSMTSPIQSPWDEQEEEDMTIGQTHPVSEIIEPTAVINPESSVPNTKLATEAEFNDPTADEETLSWESNTADLSLDFEQPQVASEPSFEESIAPATPGVPLESINLNNQAASSVSKPAQNRESYVASATQLQSQAASLLHLQSNTKIKLPLDLDVVHIGKPNGQIPPDIDVAGFPDSEVVSRIHADIRIEGDTLYIEDVGSSNGTYVNHSPLVRGNRHRLRPGDRISLGKGDLVTFVFQLS